MTAVDLFGSQSSLSWGQECARAAVVFFYGLLLFRAAGRRVFSKWSALDIIVSIVAGSNLSRALTGGAPLFGTLVATTLLLAMHWVLAHAAARWKWVSKTVEGGPIELVKNGRAAKSALFRSAISDNDLAEALRQSGVQDARDTRLIVLEPSGKITVLKAAKGDAAQPAAATSRKANEDGVS